MAPPRVRSSLVPAAVALSAMALAAGAAAAQQRGTAAPTRPPNVVYLLADDLGYGELGCYGQQKIRTPRLDALAQQGMRFTQHYCGAPVCAPSRCVLLTGRHSGHATIRDNQEHKPEGQAPIAAADVTIAELLGPHGYRSGAFGKWGLGFPGSEGDPMRQGFTRFFGYNCQREAHNYYPTHLWSDDRQVAQPGNDRGLTGAHYSVDVIQDAAKQFLRDHRAEPFFLFVPFTLPHLALQVPDAALAEYRDEFAETPYNGKSYLPHPTPRACYAAMITYLDRKVGELLDELDRLGLADNTLVVFSSDNGPTHLPAQVDVGFFASAGGLRGLKGSVYEGGIRVPMIARWPGRIAAGSTSDHVCAFQDVMPTLAELAGATVPPACDGISFGPALRGDGAGQPRHDALLWDFPGYGGQLALRHGDWKAVRRGLRQDPSAPLELYDLAADPGEQHDVAGEHAELAARLAARMVSMRTEPAMAQFRFGTYGERAAATSDR